MKPPSYFVLGEEFVKTPYYIRAVCYTYISYIHTYLCPSNNVTLGAPHTLSTPGGRIHVNMASVVTNTPTTTPPPPAEEIPITQTLAPKNPPEIYTHLESSEKKKRRKGILSWMDVPK